MRTLLENLLRRMARGSRIERIDIFNAVPPTVNQNTLYTVDNVPFSERGNQLIDTTIALFAAQIEDDVITSVYRFREYTFPAINLRHLLAFSTRNGYTVDMMCRGDQLFSSALNSDFTQENVVTPLEYQDLWNNFLNQVKFKTSRLVKLNKRHLTMKDIKYIYSTDNLRTRQFYCIVEGDDDSWQTAYGLGLYAELLPLTHMGTIQAHYPTNGEFYIWAQSEGKVNKEQSPNFHNSDNLGAAASNKAGAGNGRK